MARYSVQSETIRYRVDGEVIAACLYRPEIDSSQGGVIVVDEKGSGASQIQGVAERYGHVGYPTLLVDLWGGRLTADEADARWKSANLLAALAWLRSRPFVKAEFVGAVGFYEGAQYVLQLAAVQKKIQAAVAFYPPISTGDMIEDVRAPVLTFFGGNDLSHELTPFIRGMVTENVWPQVIVYPDVSDGFFNERLPVFNFEAAEDAWSRSNRFLYRYLGEPK